MNDRLDWLDATRIIAGVSMVGLHATADPSGQPWVNYTEAERVFPIALRTVLYTARTELFIVISIFLLLLALGRRPKTYRETIAIQSRRLLVPFLFWTFFYALYNFSKAREFGYSDQLLVDLIQLNTWIGFLLLGDVKYHMHFIPTLFAILLFYPLFRIAYRFPVLGLTVLFCLVIKRELDLFVFSEFWGQEMLPYLVRAIKVLTYVGYGMAAASFLSLWEKSSAEERNFFFSLVLYVGVALFCIKVVAAHKTVILGVWPHGFTPAFWADFLMPLVIFAGCMTMGHKQWPAWISKLAPYSFGVYLCHPIFLDQFEIALRSENYTPSEQVIIKIILTLASTSALVFALSKVKLFAWTVGLGPLPKLKFAPRENVGG